MDPVSAIGLAAAISQLAVYSGQVLGKSRKLYKSTTGVLVEHKELQTIVHTFDGFLGKLDDEKASKPLRDLAQEARVVTTDLTELLTQLHSKAGPNKAWNSVRQAMLAVSKETELQELERRVDRYHKHISSLLLDNLRDHVLKVQKSQKTDAQQTQDYFKIILDEVQRYPLITEAVAVLKPAHYASRLSLPSDFASKLLDSIDQKQSDDFVEQIIELLRFENMYMRQETISKAYKTTFDWIYQPSSAHESGCEWADFAGKPGAGKSTLMKYLYNKPETRSLAEMWLPQTDTHNNYYLSLAGFFFWNSGLQIQMSRIGFLQSMLTQLWNDSVDPAELFPRRWQRMHLFGGGSEAFTEGELTTALRNLLSTQGRFFLLFVDGLDEFEGSKEELSDMILEFSSMPNVKICAASRPWAEFQSKFHAKPQLSMERLTRGDITAYIEGQFSTSEEYRAMQLFQPDSATRLKEDIADKASGVFLWVYIVVGNLLRGMRYGDRMSVLVSKLDGLPRELDQLFSKILDQVEPECAKEASELFQFVRKFPNHSTLIALYWSQLTFQQVVGVKILPLSQAEADYHARIMERNLMSRCKCLLDVQQPILHTTKVTWLHRTVREYLDRVDIWQGLKKRSPNYDAGLAHMLSLLYQAKARTTSCGQSADDTIDALYLAIGQHIAIHNSPDHTSEQRMQIAFLDDVEKTGAELNGFHQPASNRQWLSALSFIYPATILEGTTTVFHLALVREWSCYVEHRLRADPDLAQHAVCSESSHDSLAFTTMHNIWDSQYLCLKCGGGVSSIKNVQARRMILTSKASKAWRMTLVSVNHLMANMMPEPWFKILRNIILFLEMGADAHLTLARGKTEDIISDVVRKVKAMALEPDEALKFATYQTYLKNVYSWKRALVRRLF